MPLFSLYLFLFSLAVLRFSFLSTIFSRVHSVTSRGSRLESSPRSPRRVSFVIFERPFFLFFFFLRFRFYLLLCCFVGVRHQLVDGIVWEFLRLLAQSYRASARLCTSKFCCKVVSVVVRTSRSSLPPSSPSRFRRFLLHRRRRRRLLSIILPRRPSPAASPLASPDFQNLPTISESVAISHPSFSHCIQHPNAACARSRRKRLHRPRVGDFFVQRVRRRKMPSSSFLLLLDAPG